MERTVQLMICLLTAFAFSARADGLLTPPEGLPVEKWEMHATPYRYLDTPGYGRKVGVVDVARDGNDWYFKGVVPIFPEAWVKASLKDDSVRFHHPQLIGFDEEDRPVFFNCGQAIYRYVDFEDHSGYEKTITFYSESDGGFRLWGYRNSIISSDLGKERDISNAFWFTDNPADSLVLTERSVNHNFESQFPGKPYYVHVAFYKVSDSGLDEITNDADESAQTVYDLQGRKMDSDALKPGIYIRNRKKIIIR